MERFIIWREDGGAVSVDVLLERVPDVHIVSRRRKDRVVVSMTPRTAETVCQVLPELRMQQDHKYQMLR